MKLRDISDFQNQEFKQQAANANFSKLANIMGLKPTANKVINTVMMENINTWEKVEVVSSITALKTLYMGGSSNIDGVITNMCSNYTGANNLCLLDSKGDFGSRLNKSAAASRYIQCRLSKNFSKLFNKEDLNVLPRYNFEGKDIEYQFLSYNLPLLLINGAEGMGSGHAQNILPRDPENIKKYITAKLTNKKVDPKWLYPSWNGFTGEITKGDNDNQWIIKGMFKKISQTKIEISEVPIGENYLSFKKKLNTLVNNGTIKSFDDLCDPKNDKFLAVIHASKEFIENADHQKLKLQSSITENFTVNDENNAIIRHNSVEDVIEHYIKIKMNILQKRKTFVLKRINDDISYEESKKLFIDNIINNKIIINKRSKKDIINDIEKIDGIVKKDGTYNYLLSMPLYSLSEEKIKDLEKIIKEKQKEYKVLEIKTETDLWIEDLKDL